MKRFLIVTAISALCTVPAQSESFRDVMKEKLKNPYWDTKTYTDVFCSYRNDFLSRSQKQEIATNDPELEAYMREDFDLNIKRLGVKVAGTVPADEELCKV